MSSATSTMPTVPSRPSLEKASAGEAKPRRSLTLPEKFTKVVIPIDGSDRTTYALHWAALFCRLTQVSNISLVTVNKDGSSAIFMPALQILESYGLSAKCVILQGKDVVHLLLTAITRADLVLLATRGRKGIDRLRQGSVAEALIRQAEQPVLCLRYWEDMAIPTTLTIARVLVPFDGKAPSVNALHRYLNTINDLNAAITLMYMPDWHDPAHLPQSQRDAPKKKAAAIFHLGKTLVDELIKTPVEELLVPVSPVESRSDVILRTATNGHFDLIVLGTHGRSGLVRAAKGSVTEEVCRKTRVPVLALAITC